MKEITKQEIKLIKIAMQYIYDKKLDHLKNNRKIMSENEINETLITANRYYDLGEKL